MWSRSSSRTPVRRWRATRAEKKVSGFGFQEMPQTMASSVESHTPERKAEFLLQNAVGVEDHEKVREEVRKLDVKPDSVPHDRLA